MTRASSWAAIALALLAATGCSRGSTSSRPPIHLNPNMDSQPKVTAQSESTFFSSGAAMQPPVEGTVARGALRHSDLVRHGLLPNGDEAPSNPLAVDAALKERGRERYEIYCSPCHGSSGNGKGIVATRGAMPAANLLEERFRSAPDGRIYSAVQNGVGLMPSFAARIPVEDRWAIVAHVRELQSR